MREAPALTTLKRRDRLSRPRRRLATATCALAWLAACGPAEEPPAPDVRPVRAITVEELPGGETVSLTGRIEAQEEVSLAFRVSQRLVERLVNVGDRVRAGQLVARVESTTLDNAVAAARANLASLQARAADARLEADRQRSLFERGVAPRARFESAQKARDAAVAQVDAAQAQLATAREQLGYTELFADAAGTVTAVGAEPGEVVGAGQMIVRVARKGGRDAVFDVPARVKEAAGGLDPEVTVALASDANVRATGRVREVSPQANPVTRTFEVRVGLSGPPEAMRLGSTVTGSIHLAGGGGIRIPASALTSASGAPAVWVLDPGSSTVAIRNVVLEQSGRSEVSIAEGLAPGDVVVTAGVQTLRPGQKVRLLQDAP
ncbi:MAG: efflux RND transporter periplasmic adaptor subunit [Deltaproteobacteria bacterium]|nr:efflux RND transporter periplasmic adaptor subunit [Deltaproteobacteria bacterium]